MVRGLKSHDTIHFYVMFRTYSMKYAFNYNYDIGEICIVTNYGASEASVVFRRLKETVHLRKIRIFLISFK